MLADEVWEELDGIVAGPVDTVITIGYHVRSAEPAQSRYGGSIYGPPAVGQAAAGRLGLPAVQPGARLPVGAIAQPIGNPGRQETPIFIPDAGALVFGDAVVGTDQGVRVWLTERLTPARQPWYDERLLPSLRPLLDLEADALLVTHGPPVVTGGRGALREALEQPPFVHGP